MSEDEIPIHGACDYEFECDPTTTSTYPRVIKKLIKQFEAELQEIHVTPIKGKRIDLLEVMCGNQSELTKQMMNQGGCAIRHDPQKGDLRTKEGRSVLFHAMKQHQPHHLWYSPTCGPWSQWSHLNLGKSIATCQYIMEQRQENLWQIALAITLFRFQQHNRSHFHMEQPQGSMMWHVTPLKEVRSATKWAVFDMCRMGNLRDPVSNEPIRKRLTVCTTSAK